MIDERNVDRTISYSIRSRSRGRNHSTAYRLDLIGRNFESSRITGVTRFLLLNSTTILNGAKRVNTRFHLYIPMARERGIFFFFLFPFSFLFLPRDRWKWRRVTVDDEWKIEIKAGSLNYTAQRSSCCNKMARRVIDVQRIERNVSPRVVSSTV